MSRIGRRALLLGAGAMLALGGAAASLGADGGLAAAFRALLDRHAPGVTIGDDQLALLVQDFRSTDAGIPLIRWPGAATVLARLIVAGPALPGLLAGPRDRAESALLRSLLLATDFFAVIDHGGRELRFRTSADPYRSPCANPLADLRPWPDAEDR